MEHTHTEGDTMTIKTRNKAETLVAIGMLRAMTSKPVYAFEITRLPKKAWYRHGLMLRYSIDVQHSGLSGEQMEQIVRNLYDTTQLIKPAQLS